MSEVIRFKPGYYKGVSAIFEDPKSESEIIIMAPDISRLEKHLARWTLDWRKELFKPARLVLLNKKET